MRRCSCSEQQRAYEMRISDWSSDVCSSDRLRGLALVLFFLDFDDSGLADSTWNIPLRHLAEHASAGPDMGAGPVRLACRSQCPVAWHQSQLWDPEMKPGANDFAFIRDILLERGRKMGLYIEEETAENETAVPLWESVTTVDRKSVG